MRVALFGSDEFTLGCMRAASARATNVVWHVFHSPHTRVAFQKYQCTATPLPVRTLRGWSLDTGFDAGVVASCGYFIPKSAITTPRLGMINVHPSLLPRLRGAAPIHRAIAANEALGVSLIDVHPTIIDAGDIWAQREISHNARVTFLEARDLLAQLAGEMLAQVLVSEDAFLACKSQRLPQSGPLTFAPKISSLDGKVSFTQMHAWQIDAAIRAYSHAVPITAQTVSNTTIRILNAILPVHMTNGMQQFKPAACLNESLTVAHSQSISLDNIGAGCIPKIDQCPQKSMSHDQFDKLAQEVRPGSVFLDKRTPALWVCCADGAWIGIQSACIGSVRHTPASLCGTLCISNFEHVFH